MTADMTFRLSKENYTLLETLVFNPLQKAGYEVYVFGSRVRGNNHPFSDLDILLVPKADFNHHQLMQTYLKAKEDIEESNFPIKVDFVHEKNLASSYRESVMKDRIKIA